MKIDKIRNEIKRDFARVQVYMHRVESKVNVGIISFTKSIKTLQH